MLTWLGAAKKVARELRKALRSALPLKSLRTLAFDRVSRCLGTWWGLFGNVLKLCKGSTLGGHLADVLSWVSRPQKKQSVEGFSYSRGH